MEISMVAGILTDIAQVVFVSVIVVVFLFRSI